MSLSLAKYLSVVLVLGCSFVLVHGYSIGGYPTKPNRPKQPNIIYILGDDVGFNDVGWNNPKMRTPTLDYLAKNGVILENFYATPLCTPSRAALLTGKYPFHLGLQRGVINPQEPYGVPLKFKMIPKRLKELGYATHAIGKWHLGFCDLRYTPVKRGFDTFFGFYNGAENNYYHCLNNGGYYVPETCTGKDFRKNNTDVSSVYDEQYSGYLYANRAVDIIKHHKRDKPLFMYVSFTDAHFPLQAPKKFLQKCSQFKNEARQHMCASMAATDNWVNDIMKALKESQLLDDTLIIFTSDNGGEVFFGANNLPYRGQKNTLLEGGTKVPAFVYGPNILKCEPYVNRQIFHITDWYPTIMRLAGDSEKPDLDGFDQWDTIRKNQLTSRRLIVYNVDDLNGTLVGAIRYKDYKYFSGPRGNMDRIVPESEVVDYSFNQTALQNFIENASPYNLSDTTEKLYYLRDDPTETYNLASEKPDMVAALRYVMSEVRRGMTPAVKRSDREEGNPALFGGIYSPGWCVAETHVPIDWSRFNDLHIFSLD